MLKMIRITFNESNPNHLYLLISTIAITYTKKEVIDFMNTFIKKHQYNHIKKYLHDLNNTFRNCIDLNIIETQRASLQEKILNLFTELSKEEKDLLDISKIDDPLYIDTYLAELNEYVYGMSPITNAQISKLFKKEKKFKFPNHTLQESKHVYLGWIDESTRKLFLAYHMDGKLIGMVCRIPNCTSNNVNMCTLCNHVGGENEVTFVSPICKTAHDDQGGYRSIGFNICLDSEKCNERIISTDKLEKLLKNVNNIK